MMTFQKFLNKLSAFWEEQGCIIHQGYDLEVGAGTFNPATFLRCLGPEPYRAAYIEPCRRPADGRYGENPNRLQHYFQYQVILKPSPLNIQELYLKSLEALGFDLQAHDIRFVHDDWESPTLGAWGLGWEVWMDGMEITQFTYFQSVGGVELHPVTGEITYGIERLAMYLQKVDSIFELQWNDHLLYGDIYQRNEIEWSHYNFEKASTSMWQRHFEDYEQEAKRLIEDKFPIPAYDFVMKASHAFNLLDARGAISVTERTGYIARIRDLARQIAKAYIASREEQGFPLLHTSYSDATDHEPAKQLQLPQSLLDADPGSTDDFLLEVGSEDLPAAFIPIGIAYFDREIRSLLDKEEIPYESIEVYSTPRRLGILIRNLSKGKPSKSTEKKGPSLEQAYDSSGNPKPPGEGFFRSLGISPPPVEALREGKVPQAEIRSIKGTPYLFGTMHQKGRPTAEILIEQIPSLVLNADFPKTMRWGEGNISYARPLRWMVALFGEDIVPIRIGGLEANRLTYGHRQLSPQAIPLHQPQDYLQELTCHFVQADQVKREKSILDQLDQLEAELNIQIIERDRVMPQVVNLTEWPQCTAASFKPEFLRAPKEVLISEMVEHQKYFPVCGQDGSLKNLFVITANIPPTDQIREGNQRVLSSRLSDGVFLYEEDLKIPLEAFNEKLKKVTYQKELGTVFQKVERIVAHAEIIQKDLGISSFEKVTRAAKLCKADLASNMVYEFPELQGIIGSYYALAHGEEEEIAKAINEHWMPRGEHAPLPETETGVVVSLADKFDNLLGSFAIGMKPTSSSDPYALRRQVLGIIKLLIKGKYELPLKECLLSCSSNFSPAVMPRKQETVNEILEFIANRVKTVFLDYGFSKDEIEASLAHGCKDIYDIFCRVNALHAFREQARDRFISLFEVFKRAKGQLNGQLAAQVLPEVLIETAEKELNALLDSRQTAFKQALDQRNYKEAYSLLAAIQPALAELFDKVKILADDPKIRENRLGLLKRVFNLFDELLDFSKIQEK